MTWASLCDLDELTEGRGKYVEIGGFQLAVFLNQGQVHVLDNRCPHAGGSLSGGEVHEHRAVCPWHHWAFDLESGELSDRPLVKVRAYRSRIIVHEGQRLVQAELPMY